MPKQTGYSSWAGKFFSSQYSGQNAVSISDLRLSVSNNPGGENPFWSTHASLSGSVMTNVAGPNGEAVNPNFKVLQPGPSDILTSWLLPAPLDIPWSASNLWARSNPTRPVVHLPVFWLEVRDIPDMIRQAGRFLLHARNWRQYVRSSLRTRDLATANLAFQFGWAPLLGDLYKLASFQDAVDKRRKEILNATKRGGYRRRIGLGSSSKSIPAGSGQTANFGSFASFPVEQTSGIATAQSWAVMKWRPTSPNSGIPTKDDDLRPYLLGLHPSNILENVWEALPWSWLIDYFSGIGDMLAAGNHHAATPSVGSVMTTSTLTIGHKEYLGSSLNLSPGAITRVDRRRSPIGGFGFNDFARVPNLGTGQLSILGSLATIKGRRTLGS